MPRIAERHRHRRPGTGTVQKSASLPVLKSREHPAGTVRSHVRPLQGGERERRADQRGDPIVPADIQN